MPAINKPTALICSIPGCGEPHSALGYCNKHYLRFKNGKVMEAEPRGRIHLRKRRALDLSMSQNDLAKLLGVSPSKYAHVESGADAMTMEMRRAITAAFESRRQELIAQHREAIRQLEALVPLTKDEMEQVE